MLKVNIADAKAHLSSYLDRVAQGETFEGGATDEVHETGGRVETDPVVRLRRQWEARLEAFFAQKKHLSFRDDAPRSPNEVTARLQSPRTVDRTALATAAERLLLSNPR